MTSSPAAGPTMARRMVFEPGSRPYWKLIRPVDGTGRLTTEEIIEDLPTAMSWSHLPAVPPETTPTLLVPSMRLPHTCTLQILDGDLAEHQPHTYPDAHPDHWHAFNSNDPDKTPEV